MEEGPEMRMVPDEREGGKSLLGKEESIFFQKKQRGLGRGREGVGVKGGGQGGQLFPQSQIAEEGAGMGSSG